jgi:hypothetical protein
MLYYSILRGDKMNDDDIQTMIAFMIGICVLLIVIPYISWTVFSNMENSFPTEKWCNAYNGTENVKGHEYYCFKNETGWHLNRSVPIILENVIT